MAESPLKPSTFLRQMSSSLRGTPSKNIDRSADSLRSLGSDGDDHSSANANEPIPRGSIRRSQSVSKRALKASTEKERMKNDDILDHTNIFLDALKDEDEDDVANEPKSQHDGKLQKLATHKSVRFSYDHLEADAVEEAQALAEANEAASRPESPRSVDKGEMEGLVTDHSVDIETSEESVLYPYMTLPIVRDLPTNLTMQDFSFVKEIGRGANAIVSIAKYSGQTVVIKIIRPELESSEKVQKEFDAEFNILARLNHPHVIRVFGMGHSPRKFIVLEYLSSILGTVLNNNMINPSVEKLFHRYNYPYDVMLKYARQLADALDYLHNRVNPKMSILHRGEAIVDAPIAFIADE